MESYFTFFMYIDRTHSIVFPFNYLVPLCGLGYNFQSSRSSFLNLLNLQHFGNEKKNTRKKKKRKKKKKGLVSNKDMQMYLCPTTSYH